MHVTQAPTLQISLQYTCTLYLCSALVLIFILNRMLNSMQYFAFRREGTLFALVLYSRRECVRGKAHVCSSKGQLFSLIEECLEYN